MTRETLTNMNELERWDYNGREVLYNNSPDLVESEWKPVDPVFVFSTIADLIQDHNKMRELLQETHDQDRHSDYDCNLQKQHKMKQQLLDQITEDCINGDICSDGKATLEFIKDLVNLLDEDAVAKFAAIYGYDLDQSI